MKKYLVKDKYLLSVKVMLTLTISVILIFTDVKMVKSIQLDAKNNINIINNNEKIDFIIDAPVKYYEDILKLEKASYIKFKLPDFLPEGNRIAAFQIRRLSEKSDAIEILFENSNGSFSFQVFQGDPAEVLKSIESEKTKNIENSKVEVSKEPLRLEGVSGLNIKLTTTFPAREVNNNNLKESQKISKYYVWKSEGLWYSMEYGSTSMSEESSNKQVDLSKEVILKIAKSLKYPEEIKNVNYSITKDISTDTPTLNIYDKKDLEEAKKLIKINPKFPLKINKDINIISSLVGISKDSEIDNKKINYELNNFYTNTNGSITFVQGKNSKAYEEIKDTGYLNDPNNNSLKTKAEKLSINSIEVFKYSSKGLTSQVNYLWKENDIYYSVIFYVNINSSDEIVKEFVNSKPIE